MISLAADTKRCHGECGRELPIGSFPAIKRSSDGRHHWCYECIRRYKKQWAAEHPGYHRKRYLERTYGITLEQYASMIAAQDGKCAICGTTDPGGVKGGLFAVDHDHETNEIRGLLCFHCNTGLGHFEDNTDRLEAALRYLQATTRGAAAW